MKKKSKSKVDSTRTAIISDCEKYRYTLFRMWEKSKPTIMFIMLNPSTADATFDDPTIRRCIAFAKKWGYGSLYVGNLFAYRSTDPKGLLTANNPIGKENKYWLDIMANISESIVCAWGNSNIVDKILIDKPDYKPLKGISNLKYLELSINGTPKHPLYLKGDLQPKEYEIVSALNTYSRKK